MGSRNERDRNLDRISLDSKKSPLPSTVRFSWRARCRAVDHALGARSSADSGPGDGANSDPGAPCARGDARSR